MTQETDLPIFRRTAIGLPHIMQESREAKKGPSANPSLYFRP